VIIHDDQATAVLIADAKGTSAPNDESDIAAVPPDYDAASVLALTYLCCLFFFGVASTVYIFPSQATQYTGIVLLALTCVPRYI